jgi:putative transposase
LLECPCAHCNTIRERNANALAESFVDSFKTELIADRVWRTRSQLELAVVEYVAWFNQARLHSALGYRPPAEIEADYYTQADAANQVYGPFGVVSDLRC